MTEENKAVNRFDDVQIAEQSFAFLDLTGQDKWNDKWTVSYSFATATGLTVVGRFKVVGKMCHAQIKSSGTSLATTAGASYIALPVSSKGYGGTVVMFNATTNVSVGTGGIDVANSRAYLPTQGASANTFTFAFSWEI